MTIQTIVDNYKLVFNKAFQFSGRATRSEYWLFALANFMISILLSIVDSAIFGNGKDKVQMFSSLFSLITLIPSIAVMIRRLHDTDKSGWFALLLLIPFIGWLILLIWFVTDSTPGDNKYGPNPKAKTTPTPTLTPSTQL